MDGPQPKPLYGALTVYRERGAYLRRQEQFDKAEAAYDEAFNNNPEDVRLLIGRSQVRIDSVKPSEALNDVELALNYDPNNITGKHVRASALYTLSEFERSAVMNYRGERIRKQPPYFKEGINQGEFAIRNCIGDNAGHVMLDFLPIIRKMEDINLDENEPEHVMHKSRIPHPERKQHVTQMQALKNKTLSRVLAMKYLGPMAYDKFFLQALILDKRLKGANIEGSKKLRELAIEALQTLTERQDMLRAQRPYYSIKFAEKTESKYQTQHKKALLESERRINTSTAERLVRQIEKSMRSNRVMDLIAKAERMQLFLDTKTPRTLPDKDAYIERLYRAVGEGYLSQHRISYRMSERSNKRRIAFLMGLPIGRPTSFDSVIATYPYKFVEPKQAVEKLLKDLDMCEHSYMKCWLMYEISHLLNLQKNYALGKFYAKRCQREAQDIGSTTWWMNACFMLISGDLQQGNTNEIRVMVEEAYEWSKKLKNSERIQAFLAKCSDLASESLTLDEGKAIVHRENQILKVMDDTLRDDTRVLFKRISTLPQGRRFSVLPAKSATGEMISARHRRRQRGISVIPGPEKSLPAPPRSAIPGYQVFDL